MQFSENNTRNVFVIKFCTKIFKILIFHKLLLIYLFLLIVGMCSGDKSAPFRTMGNICLLLTMKQVLIYTITPDFTFVSKVLIVEFRWSSSDILISWEKVRFCSQSLTRLHDDNCRHCIWCSWYKQLSWFTEHVGDLPLTCLLLGTF